MLNVVTPFEWVQGVLIISLATVIIGTGLMVFLSQAQKRTIQSKREYRRSVDGLKRLANQAHYENNHGVVSDDDA